ncbi:Calx-beta domain-containing protein [Microbulbifer rhizosphaerae]|uniref:F5/8 type C domain-containing protein n=1 Tax=Microbulbifer rhizosphaerae TaxID=1562603 RepID=A0A7W4WBF9_9GAMM|nr:discoidin domain-containing protein [Microbulbifer rhizosphaerae]MBB3061188.1 hypothetical protein [Microbulbifer rhizosphaerae]
MSIKKLKMIAALLAGGVFAGLSLANTAHADSGESVITDNIVEINETISPEGFKHPGIRFTKESLENLRTQVIAGQEPWASYYEGMRRRWWASLNYGPRNHNGNGYPAHDVISHNGLVAGFIDDAQAALMHSIQYVVTGDERHRAKAMYIVGVYSNMNPNGVEYFADVHIKMGQPIYHMTAAAEILRATSTTDPELEWTEELTYKYVNNFLQPQMDAYIRNNRYFMNQYSYALAGNVAAAIFADDRAAYEEAVEWTTVGSTAENQGWVGSIERVFRLMTHNDETGEPLDDPYVQLAEMGRDQPHAIGNVDTLFIISQIISSQGTKVDPVAGTISTADNAVDPVHFSDDALRKAFIEFIKYNVGYDIRWTPIANDISSDGTINSIYKTVNAQGRGRLSGNVYRALYYYFKYSAGYDLSEGENRYIQLAYDANHQAGWQSIRRGDYWGPREHVYNSEFWAHLPASVADTSVPPRGEPRETLDEPPAWGPGHLTEFELREIVLDGSAEEVFEEDLGYLRVQANPFEPTNFTLWGGRYSSGVNTLRVRTDGPARVEFSHGHTKAPASSLYLPDTGGEWRYVPVDTSRQSIGGSSGLKFFRIFGEEGSVTVDFDHLNRDEAVTAAAPQFNSLSTEVVSYAGGAFERDFGVTAGTTDVVYSLAGEVPASASIDPLTGQFHFAPGAGQSGEYRLQVVAENDTYKTSHAVTITVGTSAEDAVDLIAAALDTDKRYVSATRLAFYAAKAVVQSAILTMAPAAEIDAALTEFLATSKQLQELNPVIAEDAAKDDLGLEPDGVRLNYPKMVAWSNTWLGHLVDGDPGTFNSRWGDPSVTMDFGANFRIRATALHIQARGGFPERLQDGRLEGSHDGENWVRLTDSAVYGGEMQRLAVYPEYQNTMFRYLRVISPHCACGVFDIGEMYLFGERQEIVSDLATAPGRWFVGQTLEIPVAVTPPQDDPVEFSVDLPAGAVFDLDNGLITWTPTADQTGEQTLSITADYGFAQVEDNLSITISESANAVVDELLATLDAPESYSDSSWTMLARAEAEARDIAADPNMTVQQKLESIVLFEQAMELMEPKHTGDEIDTGRFAAILASHPQYGDPEIDESLAGLPAFDGTGAFVSLEASSGTWVQADFGEGNYVSLTRVRLTPRWDFGRRLNNAVIAGSNDGENWTTLARVPYNEYLNATWDNHVTTLEVSDATAYRYVRFFGHNGTHGNVAEIELFGTGDYVHDDLTLRYLQLKASTLDAAHWSDASWRQLQDMLAQVEAASGIYAVAEATAALDTALNSLIPASGNLSFDDVPGRWFVGESLEFSIFPEGMADAGMEVEAALPAGASFNPLTGQVSWTPGSDQVGDQSLEFDIGFDFSLLRIKKSLSVTVYTDGAAVVDEILATVGLPEQYTSFSLDMLARAESDVREIVENPEVNPYRKLSYLRLLEQAISLLEPFSDDIDVSGEATILASHHKWGNPSVDVTLSGLPAFDGTGSYVDLQSASGTWIQADFGEGRYVSLTRVRLTPRWNYGRRLNNAVIAGSNDGENWTTLVRVPYNHYLNATWDNKVTTLEVSDATTYRYVRFFGHNGSHGNVAKIELFGTHNFDYDDRTLPYLIAKAGILVENDWTADSWQYLMDVLAVAQAMIEEGGSDEALYADATAMLDEALNTLVPASSYLDFIVANVQASEADGSITLLVSRTGGTLGAVSADFATLAGSASAGEDFVDTNGTLTWGDGDMDPKAVVVSLVNDGYLEDEEDFTVKLENADNGVIGDSGEAQVTLIDDDSDALPGLSIADASLVEGDGKLPFAASMQFEVSLSGTARQPVKVLIRTQSGTAKNGRDFIPLGRVVHFAAGEKSKVVEVRVRPDDKREGDEQFTLEAKWAKGAEIQDGVGVGTILDDD